jgi:hypothetical protein
MIKRYDIRPRRKKGEAKDAEEPGDETDQG